MKSVKKSQPFGFLALNDKILFVDALSVRFPPWSKHKIKKLCNVFVTELLLSTPGGNRTPTPEGTGFWIQRVYQFRHRGEVLFFLAIPPDGSAIGSLTKMPLAFLLRNVRSCHRGKFEIGLQIYNNYGDYKDFRNSFPTPDLRYFSLILAAFLLSKISE